MGWDDNQRTPWSEMSNYKQLSFDDAVTHDIQKSIARLSNDVQEIKDAIKELPDIIKDMTEQLNEILDSLEEE
jgi:prefoldin subunit 5